MRALLSIFNNIAAVGQNESIGNFFYRCLRPVARVAYNVNRERA